MTIVPQKILSSYHEAGHAVIATVLGVPVEYVSIGIDPKFKGETQYKDIGMDEDNDYKRKRIIAALAGGFASLEHDPNRLTSLDDYDRASKLAIQIVGNEEKDEYLKIAETWAKKEVNKNKKSIKTVAEALNDKGELNGKVIEEIIKKLNNLSIS